MLKDMIFSSFEDVFFFFFDQMSVEGKRQVSDEGYMYSR